MPGRRHHPLDDRHGRLCTALVVTLLLGPSCAAAQATADCHGALEVAAALYIEGRFGEVRATLQPCLDGPGVSVDEAAAALRLLALTHLQEDDLQGARAAIVRLLRAAPRYVADPVMDPPVYYALVDIVRRQLGEPPAGAEPPPPGATASEPPPEPVVDDAEEEARRSWVKSKGAWLTAAAAFVAGGVLAVLLLRENR